MPVPPVTRASPAPCRNSEVGCWPEVPREVWRHVFHEVQQWMRRCGAIRRNSELAREPQFVTVGRGAICDSICCTNQETNSAITNVSFSYPVVTHRTIYRIMLQLMETRHFHAFGGMTSKTGVHLHPESTATVCITQSSCPTVLSRIRPDQHKQDKVKNAHGVWPLVSSDVVSSLFDLTFGAGLFRQGGWVDSVSVTGVGESRRFTLGRVTHDVEAKSIRAVHTCSTNGGQVLESAIQATT